MSDQLNLHGQWPSPFVYRVIWALKLKGIPYEYMEEDVVNNNKSPLLLQYNPVYKKIPVLVHGGKPICESMVIVQYIEDIWSHTPNLLPTDPHDKAVARLWIKFADDKGVAMWIMFHSSGKEQEIAMNETLDFLETVEEHGGLGGEKKFFNGDNIGMVDIAFGSVVYWLEVLQDISGVKLIEPSKFPRLHSWILNFKEDPIIKDNLPNYNDMLVYFKRRRQVWLGSA